MKIVAKIVITLLVIGRVAVPKSVAQPLAFERSSHDFGRIEEDGGVVECRFRFKNIAAEPIVITRVYTSCGCTKSEYSRQPILPDSCGVVTLKFDPVGQPAGVFNKSVVVHTSLAKPTQQLHISGEIIPRQLSFAERFPIEVGEGVRLDRNALTFGYIRVGQNAGAVFNIANTSQREVSLAVRPTDPDGILSVDCPPSLAAGDEATLSVVYPLAEHTGVYGTLHDVLNLEIDGRVSEIPLVVSAIAVDDYDNFADKGAARMEVCENFIKFGSCKVSDSALRRVLTFRNSGAKPLIIRKVESSSEAFVAEIVGGEQIASGEKGRLKVVFTPAACNLGATTARIRVITNDPVRPMCSIRVSAIVEQ